MNKTNEVQLQVQVEPNIYTLTNMQIISAEEEFTLIQSSGNTIRRYSLSPKHAKRVLLLLQQTISAYEEIYGELKTDLIKSVELSQEKVIGFHSGNS